MNRWIAVLSGVAILASTEFCRADETECFRGLNANKGKRGKVVTATDLKLEGTASGGELVLLRIANADPPYVTIETQAGEPASSVLARLASAINETRPFSPDSQPHVRSEGNLLKSFPGLAQEYAFAGTEIGLGIPSPPTSISISYSRETEEFSLSWENPVGPYDAIGTNIHGGEVAGTATSLVWKSPPPERRAPKNELERFRDRRDKGLRAIYVLGCRDGVLSNAAVITYDFDDDSQQELDVPPFTAGIHPNWNAWHYGGASSMLILEQGTKGGAKRVEQSPKRPLKPDETSFFQVIKTGSSELTGGLYRRFLGLKPGHTYRVSTRMNTFEMGKLQDDWSFSFRAVAHAKEITLTSAQMAGAEPLSKESAGGVVAAFGPDTVTKGKFVEVETGKKARESQIGDIVLPAGAEVITVWFKYSGPPCSGVGFDWIKLKDVTAK